MLLQHARRGARTDPEGDLVLLKDQDRAAWDRQEIDEGLRLMSEIEDSDGPYALQAAIAAGHASAPTWQDTDWHRIVALYDRLWPVTGSPVVGLNRAVAVGYASGPKAGLEAMVGLDLDGYHAFHASRAEMLRRSGDEVEARAEFLRALESSANQAERRLIEMRLDSLSSV
jgi:RNA polymerase sigma-70 factor (ECF subfamily)